MAQHQHRTLIAGLSSAAVALALPLAGAAQAGASTGSHLQQLTRSHSPLNAQDRHYLRDSAQGDRFEVLGGALAETSSARPDVQAFGQRMVTDHAQAYADTVHNAARLGFVVPTAPSAGQEKVLALWGSTKKATFDCAYITYEWVDHQLDIATTKDEIARGHDRAVVREARQSLPLLRQQLQLATSILQSLGGC